MKDTMALGRDHALEELRKYVVGLGVPDTCITSDNSWVTINLPDCTPENVVDIKNIFFWNLEVPQASGLVEYSHATECLHVYLQNYDTATKVYEKLVEFGAHVVKFESGVHTFSFSYTLNKVALNYDELEEIRNIANPARNREHPVHQTTMYHLTSLSVHPDIK